MKKFALEDYESYKNHQVSRSIKKWSSSTFYKEIRYFHLAIREAIQTTGVPKSIACMGIRNGNEYFAFKEMEETKNAEIYGVDINPEVVKVGPNCIASDFSELPEDWAGKFEWVYSNSLDHAFDVKKTIKEWHRVSNKYVFISLSKCGIVSHSDIYDFTEDDVQELFGELFDIKGVWSYEGMNYFNVLLQKK